MRKNYTHIRTYINVHYLHENDKLYNIQTVAKHTLQTHKHRIRNTEAGDYCCGHWLLSFLSRLLLRLALGRTSFRWGNPSTLLDIGNRTEGRKREGRGIIDTEHQYYKGEQRKHHTQTCMVTGVPTEKPFLSLKSMSWFQGLWIWDSKGTRLYIWHALHLTSALHVSALPWWECLTIFPRWDPGFLHGYILCGMLCLLRGVIGLTTVRLSLNQEAWILTQPVALLAKCPWWRG